MKLIIDIPEEQYITLNAKSQEEVLAVIDVSLLIKAIKNGTPLPKGHGDLVDMQSLIENYWDGSCMEIHTDDLDNIPIVIEADHSGKG